MAVKMKKAVLKGNMLIAQSGGPSMVINQSLVGAVLEAKKHAAIKNIFGSRFGIKGILEENMIQLRRETSRALEAAGPEKVRQAAIREIATQERRLASDRC